MARPRKIINNTPYPDHVIDSVARALYPNLLEDWQNMNKTNQHISDTLSNTKPISNSFETISITN